jgi:predicted TIM-barrel fold metal-dependent hydrolase
MLAVGHEVYSELKNPSQRAVALATVSACDNVAIKIFGMECIFGIHWTVAQIRPWILDSVELFGPNRCMFASHLPICKLACSVQQLYGAYLEAIAGFSVSEKRQMLHDHGSRDLRVMMIGT